MVAWTPTRDVGVGANVLSELAHESTAEFPDLVVGLALGVEISAAFATTHVQAGERILEDLLETQELQDRQVHGGVKSKTALVGTKSRVELHTVAPVDLDLALVVFPDHAELDDSLGDRADLERGLVLRVLLEKRGVLESRNQLLVRLLKLGLSREVRHFGSRRVEATGRRRR